MTKKHEALRELLNELDALRAMPPRPAALLERLMAFYQPILIEKYPDDYPKRQAGLEQLSQISVSYSDMEQFLGDLSLDGDPDEEKRKENAVVLSTVHSAKGLEWSAVVIIDLVEDRFPSRKAMQRSEDLEEERRLMYVACTRAKKMPQTLRPRFGLQPRKRHVRPHHGQPVRAGTAQYSIRSVQRILRWRTGKRRTTQSDSGSMRKTAPHRRALLPALHPKALRQNSDSANTRFSAKAKSSPPRNRTNTRSTSPVLA